MHLRRRLLVLGAASALAPLRLLAQAGRKVTVALLSTGRSNEDDNIGSQFSAEMQRLGWREGQNIAYLRFFTEGSRARLPEIAAAAVARKPDLIFAPTGAAAGAAVRATSSIPVVFVSVSDPIAAGLIKSLPRPGGNATGVFHMGGEIISKRLELVREALPRAKRIGVLLDTVALDAAYQREQHEQSARPRGLEVTMIEFRKFEEVPPALERLKKEGVDVATMSPSFTLAARRREFVDLARRQGLGIVGYRAEWAQSGALFSYGADVAETQRRSAEMATRILKGAKPAEMPVERAARFELLVNQGTAKALGIRLPKILLARADRVIE